MKEDLIGMAKAASEAIKKVPLEERGREVAMGADGTPTSLVDKVAEDSILKFLEDNGIADNFLSEEAGWIDNGSEYTLVVDPVDGTYNASRGIPFFSVSIARGKSRLGDLVEGIVLNVVSDDVFYAEKGKGAFLNDKRLHVNESNGKPVLMTYLGSNASPRTYDIASRFRRVRALGAASLDLCAVAGGQADAYYLDFQPASRSLRVMDIAAGILILREAGGEAYDIVGNILDMPLSLDVRTNVMAVGSNPILELML